jgi:ferritin-like metal-binding protein YciE
MLDTLERALNEQLRDLYSAENQLVRALPKMAKAASSDSLKRAIEDHLEQTRGHVQRLEQAAEMLEFNLGGKKCKAMEGLIAEGSEVLDEDGEEPLLDLALIAAAQRVEHYEMAAYGCARSMAEKLGKPDVAQLLQQTLDEEGAANKKLTSISTSEVLPAAANIGHDGMAEDDET